LQANCRLTKMNQKNTRECYLKPMLICRNKD
jgi:hypothetical protein